MKEYESHNPPYLILSKSPDSYIVGNLASYDKRQYPESKHGGQGFGHCFVIPRERIFNIVDPDATANQCHLLNEMKDHFINFWNTAEGPTKLLDRVRSAFDEQNLKLKSSGGITLREDVEVDFEGLSKRFMKCKPDDFEFAFHPYPAISVGHLHMHVFPKNGDLRKFSTKIHDWKTIPIEAVLEVEKEDEKESERRLAQLGRG